jgi:hypothetical protein
MTRNAVRTLSVAGWKEFATTAVACAIDPDSRIAQFEAGLSPNIIALSATEAEPLSLDHSRQCEGHVTGGR